MTLQDLVEKTFTLGGIVTVIALAVTLKWAWWAAALMVLACPVAAFLLAVALARLLEGGPAAPEPPKPRDDEGPDP